MSTSPPPVPPAGALEEVREGVWAIRLPFHAHYPGETLTYLIDLGDGSLCLVDPAWRTDGNHRLLRDGLARIGRAPEDIGLLVVTHLHPDHIGLAEDLRRVSGAPIVLHPADQAALAEGLPLTDVGGEWFARWGVPPERWPELVRWWVEERRYPFVQADLLLDDGARLPGAGRDLIVLHTPGHTAGSICLVDEADDALFTGDHLLPGVYPGIGLGGASAGNAITEYLDSLEKVRPYDGFEALPGHGLRFAPLGERRERIAAHHLRRSAEVAAALDALRSPSVWDVASHLRWSVGWAEMRDYRLASALSQTALHVERLGRTGETSLGTSAPPSE